MGESRSGLPGCQPVFCVGGILGDQFDRCGLRICITELRLENGAVLGAAHVLAQKEFSIDRLSFPLFPHLGHGYLCERARVLSAYGSSVPSRDLVPALHRSRDFTSIATSALGAIRKNEYCEADMELLQEVANQVALAVANMRSYEEITELKARLEKENVYLQEEIRTDHNFEEITGNSPALLDVLRKVEQVAPTDSTVLIYGETGTGKELIARAIHDRSARQKRPLLKVNCSAISAGLVESELFGHVKGAFTGALERHIGRFELADGGTIFLDEIGELPLGTQVKLLRVLQEREFEPVGSNKPVRVDVRVIAATNRNLQESIRTGEFRSDLFYRLNVFPIEVPPLRERRSDIPQLAMFFLARFSKKFGKDIQGIPRVTMDRLVSYSWPGNVRELQNIIERAAILSQSSVLELEPDLIPALTTADGSSAADKSSMRAHRTYVWTLEQQGHQRPGVTPVRIELIAERFAQGLFFEADFAPVRQAHEDQRNRRVNLPGDEGSAAIHPEDSGVNRMADEAVRA